MLLDIGGRLPMMTLYFTWYSGRGISSFILPLYMSSIGMSIVQIGTALGISGASLLVFELLWGFVLDSYVWANVGLQEGYLAIGLPMLGVLLFYLATYYRRS